MIYIYCLFNPLSGHPFYVGATCYKLNIRLANHISECKVYGPDRWSRKMSFINKLLSDGIKPKIRLIYISDIDTVDHYERFFHGMFVYQGYTLLQKPTAFSYKNTQRNGRYVSKYKQLRKYNKIIFKNTLIIIW
jgi:hypothetical protein